jgi:outer membrane protein TolC
MKPYPLMLVVLIQLFSQAVWAGEAAPVLTLEQAVEMALANHPTLQLAGPAADLMQAQIQGERSMLYPKLTARFVVPFVGTESGVTLHQHIWDFRQTQHRIEASRAQAQASGFAHTGQREDVILTVKVAYYTVLIQQLVKTEAEHRLRTLEKRLEQIEGLFNIGRRSKAELTQVRMNLDQSKLTLATARHDTESARIQLAAAMGLSTALPYELTPEVDHDQRDVDLKDELQSALAHRSELRQQDAHLAALNAQAAAAKQSVYPTIFGRLAYRIEGEGAEQPGFVVGIGIQGTIFDGFATAAKAQEAKAQVRRAEAEMVVKKQQIAMEVQQAILRWQLAAEHIQVTQHSQREAEENLQVMTEQFRLGRISAVELAEAEWLVASATSQHVQSIYTAKIALAQLERATGRNVDK